MRIRSYGGGVLAALSGGADSVALLYALLDSGANVSAAHLNHCLRGAASDADEQFCRELCAELGVPFVTERRDIEAEKQKGEGTEECARRVRYAFLESAAKQMDCTYVATAHNANDNAETFLMNVARGTGLNGLRCIAPERVLGTVTLVRPLLDYTRDEIERYLDSKNVKWTEDATNADLTYTRNYVRHEIIPRMLDINPRFVEHCRDLISDVRQDVSASRSALSRRHIEAIAGLMESEKASAAVSLPGGLAARREYGRIVIEAAELPEAPLPVPLGLGTTLWGDWQIKVEKIPESKVEENLAAALLKNDEKVSETESKFFVNALRFSCLDTLAVRSRLTGDTVSPLGAGWTKSIKKLLIDCKIPKLQRIRYPIVTVSDSVAAIPHCAVDRKFAARMGESALAITFQKIDEI